MIQLTETQAMAIEAAALEWINSHAAPDDMAVVMSLSGELYIALVSGEDTGIANKQPPYYQLSTLARVVAGDTIQLY